MVQSLLFFFVHIIVFSIITCQDGGSDLANPIKKCFCKGDEALSKDGCIKKSPLHVQIWNNTEANAVDISTVNITVIEQLTCPRGFTKETMFEWAFISTDGKLLKHPHTETDLYCIENVADNSGKVNQKIEMCLPKFSLRICCKTDEYMDSSGRCTIIPTLRMKKFASDFVKRFFYARTPIECKDNKTQRDILDPFVPLSVFNHTFLMYKEMTQDNFCLGMYGDENELYPGITYCASLTKNQSQVILPNIPFCCPSDQVFSIENQTCVVHSEVFSFPKNLQWPSQGALNTGSAMNCTKFSILQLNESTSHFFSGNGSLHSEFGHTVPFHKYCLGAVVNGNKIVHSGLACLTTEDKFLPCLWRWDIYRICLGISSVFLVATLIVYLGIPDLRKRIGGVCLICELFALLVSQVTLIVLQTKQNDFSTSGCLAIGVIEIIFILASFFWLNIMCYDVWTTFRVFRPYSEKTFNKKLFIKYSLYGWGIPVIVGIVAVVLQKTHTKLNPNFTPETGCFFADYDLFLHWFYIYGLILLLLLINVGFFVHLFITLEKNNKEHRKTFRGSAGISTANQQNQDLENMKLYGKLFIIMGLPWLIEVFTSFASREILCYIWFLDLLNMLRGVLIFVIFVCKKSTRDMIIKSWCSSYKPQQETSQPSRKTSTISLTSWLPSFHGRKISKVSMTSSGNVNLEAVKEEDGTIKEEK